MADKQMMLSVIMIVDSIYVMMCSAFCCKRCGIVLNDMVWYTVYVVWNDR